MKRKIPQYHKQRQLGIISKEFEKEIQNNYYDTELDIAKDNVQEIINLRNKRDIDIAKKAFKKNNQNVLKILSGLEYITEDQLSAYGGLATEIELYCYEDC